MNKLEELAARVEAATGPDRELDGAIGRAVGATPLMMCDTGNVEIFASFTASLDAALTLVPEGWFWQVGQGNHAWAAVYENPIAPSMRVDPIAATPALALCSASLQAIAALRAHQGGK